MNDQDREDILAEIFGIPAEELEDGIPDQLGEQGDASWFGSMTDPLGLGMLQPGSGATDDILDSTPTTREEARK